MIGKIISVLIIAGWIGLMVWTWGYLGGTYHYVGMEKLSFEKARQMQVDHSKSESNNIQIVAYNSSADEIYVSYNFYGDENNVVKYGIPLGEYYNNLGSKILITVFGTLFTLFFAGLAWDAKQIFFKGGS